MELPPNFVFYVKGCLRYKTITSQNVPYEVEVKIFLSRRKVTFRSQDIQVKVPCFTILGGIGHTTYFRVDEKALSLMGMIRKLDSEVNKTDQIKFFVCWMENSAST